MGAGVESGTVAPRSNAETKVTAPSAPILETPHPLQQLAQAVPGVKIQARERESIPSRTDGSKDISQREWNTKNLGSRLLVDFGAAATAGGLVAPVVSMIDRAIMENASGKNSLLSSLRGSLAHLVTRPHLFLTTKPFALILMTYGGTYLAANTLDTARSTTQGRPASTVTSGAAKFAATSATNMGLGLYKDSQYTKMFGTVAARPIPPVSYALFALRDSLTIFASFNLPPLLAPNLPLSESAEKYVSRASTAQFIAPAAIQLLSTPLHLMGLDLYNRNGGTLFSDRLNKVRLDWLKSSIARMCRIVPAFGFGGVVNTGMRKKLMTGLE